MKNAKQALQIAEAIRSALPLATRRQAEAEADPKSGRPLHPFDHRNIHPCLPKKTRKLFDDGHFSEATFEATKYVDNCVKKLSGVKTKTGYDLMMTAFNEEKALIKVNALQNTSDRDEQVGIKFLFAGVSAALRNPRGHEIDMVETVDECLDNLSVISFLLRRLETAGYTLL